MEITNVYAILDYMIMQLTKYVMNAITLGNLKENHYLIIVEHAILLDYIIAYFVIIVLITE